jgi:hypothetical protein
VAAVDVTPKAMSLDASDMLPAIKFVKNLLPNLVIKLDER